MLDKSFPDGLTVTIEGKIVTENIMAGSALEWSLVDLEAPEPITQIGSIELSAALGGSLTAADLDPITSALMQQGALVLVDWGGQRKAAARVDRATVTEFSPCTTDATRVRLDLTDKLTLAARGEKATDPVPPVAVKSFGVGVIPWTLRMTSLIRRMRGTLGYWFSTAEINTTGIDPYLSGLDDEGNPIADGFSAPSDDANPIERAAYIAATRGYYLWCDEFEQVQLIPYGQVAAQAEAEIRLACEAVDLVPEEILQDVEDEIEVFSIQLKTVIKRDQWPRVINTRGALPDGGSTTVSASGGFGALPSEPGRIGIIKRRIEYEPQRRANSWTQSWREYGRKFIYNPGLNSTTMVLAATGQTRKEYRDLFQTEERIIERRARTAIDSETFEDDFALVEALRDTTDWRLETRTLGEEAAATYSRKQRRLQRLAFSDGNEGVLEERDTEEWDRNGRGACIGKRSRLISRGLIDESLDYPLVPDPNFRSEDGHAEALPEPPLKTPDEEVELVRSSSLVGLATGIGTRRQLTVDGVGNISAYARQQLLGRSYRRITFEVSRGVTPNTTCRPLMREDIGVNTLLRDGVRLEWGDGSLTYAYTGMRVGTVAAVLLRYAPRIDFDALSPALQLATVADLTLSVGIESEQVRLIATGGQLPYTFSAVGLPPGSVLDGDLLTLKSEAAGSFSITITVEDGLASTSDQTIALTVAPAPEPQPVYSLTIPDIDDRLNLGDRVVKIVAIDDIVDSIFGNSEEVTPVTAAATASIGVTTPDIDFSLRGPDTQNASVAVSTPDLSFGAAATRIEAAATGIAAPKLSFEATAVRVETATIAVATPELSFGATSSEQQSNYSDLSLEEYADLTLDEYAELEL